MNFLCANPNEYDNRTIEILVLMFYTTSLTATSKILKIPQIRVRYIFNRTLQEMKDKKHWELYEIFSIIKNNKNKVKRLYK